MSSDERDLTELLSEIYNVDRQAENPLTREFLEAGEGLLYKELTRDAGRPIESGGESADSREWQPFEEVLGWLSRSRVVEEAQRRWTPDASRRKDRGPTDAAIRHRWKRHAGYLRDLTIWALAPRMKRPRQIGYADEIIDRVRCGEHELPAAIHDITSEEIRALKEDKAFRLQLAFQATLAHDPRVADALQRIDAANVNAWSEFAERSYRKLGLSLRKDMTFTLLGCALHTAGEGAMFRAMLPKRKNHAPPDPADLLNLIAKALVLASIDTGDGETLDEILDKFVKRQREVT